MITLKGRTKQRTVPYEPGLSLLDLALKHEVDWAFSCTRGTCARCRCQVEEGREALSETTDAEWDRLDDDELEQGYRLGCQAVPLRDVPIRAVNRTYF